MSAVEEAEGLADELVRRAHARAYRYPEAFAGFRASLDWRIGERSGEGAVVARSGPEIELEVDAADDDRAWVERELRSIVGHRQASAYERGDGRHTKRVADEPGHPLGVLVELGDEYASSYRVSGDELAAVTRTMGDRRFTIVVHERAEMGDGTALPTAVHGLLLGRRDRCAVGLGGLSGRRGRRRTGCSCRSRASSCVVMPMGSPSARCT